VPSAPGDPGERELPPRPSVEDTIKKFLSMPDEAAPGLSGQRTEWLKASLKLQGGPYAAELRKAAGEILHELVLAGLDGKGPAMWRDGRLVLLLRPEKPGCWRPITLVEVVRRVTSKLAIADPRMQEVVKDLEAHG